MTFFRRQVLGFILTIIGILLAGCLPSFFQGVKINPQNYVNEIGSMVKMVIHPASMVFTQNHVTYPLFPFIWEPYIHSMLILFGGLIFGFLLAFALVYMTFFLPEKAKKVIISSSFIGESLPDLMVIVIFQIIVVWIYNKTGIMFLNIIEGFNSNIYILPMICLSILPACFFYKMILMLMKEQLTMDYVDFARSKGIDRYLLMLRHIFRNVAIPLVFYSKTVVWLALSNMVMLEYLFNIHGFMMFIIDHPSPTVLTMGLFLIFSPFFLIYTIFSGCINILTGQKVVV